jgi:diguanylate cyclase (GGDEF)-like protein
VLPETRDDGAERLWARVHRETGTASFAGTGPTVSVGLVEWRPSETSGALDARAVAAVGRTSAAELEGAGVAVATAVRFGRERRPAREDAPGADLQARLRERLTQAIAAARDQGQELAVAAVEVGDLGPVERELGAEVAGALRAHVAARIEDCVDEGSVVSRLDQDRYAIVLPRATAADAETTLAVLQAALEVRPRGLEAGSVTVSAGIAELTAADDAAALLERAASALRQARAAGSSAVVVAGPDR